MIRSRAAYDRWFGPPCVALAWAGIVVALLHPPHGFGVQICMTQAAIGAPCPGCGITRALSSAAHGMYVESWNYHPFGIPILLLFAFTVLLSLLPKAARRRFATSVIRHHRPVNILYLGFVIAFTAYGMARSILHVMG